MTARCAPAMFALLNFPSSLPKFAITRQTCGPVSFSSPFCCADTFPTKQGTQDKKNRVSETSRFDLEPNDGNCHQCKEKRESFFGRMDSGGWCINVESITMIDRWVLRVFDEPQHVPRVWRWKKQQATFGVLAMYRTAGTNHSQAIIPAGLFSGLLGSNFRPNAWLCFDDGSL